MKWRAIWAVLRVVGEHAPQIIAAVKEIKKEKEDAGGSK